jgi:hypothetical protein
MTRRGLLLGLALAGCAGEQGEKQAFPLLPGGPPPTARGPVLLLRPMAAAPGLENRGLRRARPGGGVEVDYWNEWLAPPASLAEAALRRLLARRFVVVAPGSAARPALTLETELLTLEADTGAMIARAALGAVLTDAGGQVLWQGAPSATAPLASGRAADVAAACNAALAAALAQIEQALTPARRRVAGAMGTAAATPA